MVTHFHRAISAHFAGIKLLLIKVVKLMIASIFNEIHCISKIYVSTHFLEFSRSLK